MSKYKNIKGFTLIEVLVVIGILATLAGITLIAINPARQFAQARDSQRLSHVNTILNSIIQNIAENKGVFKCNGEVKEILQDEKTIKSPAGTDGIDLYDCLVPKYIPEIPIDPKVGNLTSPSSYDTHYKIKKGNTESGGRITIISEAEIEENRPINATK